MSDDKVVDGHFDEGEFFADPKKITKIPVPAIRGWIEVRDEITIDEERAVFAKAFKGQVTTKDGDTRNEFDVQQIGFGNVVLYVTAWSLRKPLTAAAIRALKPGVYKAIDAAVQKHLDAVTEGNVEPPSAPAGEPTSPSVA
jgi:hypothetical protein